MADDYAKFSCLFDTGSAEHAACADDIRGALAAELDRDEGLDLGFDMQRDHEASPGVLWIHGYEHGEPDHVVQFVLRCAEEFRLQGRWGFCWSLSCSRPRLDGDWGGAVVLDLRRRRTVADLDCASWLGRRLDTPRRKRRRDVCDSSGADRDVAFSGEAAP